MARELVRAVITYRELTLITQVLPKFKTRSQIRFGLPGSLVEPNESHRQALEKYLNQQAGLEMNIDGFLVMGRGWAGEYATWYKCSTRTDKINPAMRSMGLRWVQKNQVSAICCPISTSWPKEVKEYLSSL